MLALGCVGVILSVAAQAQEAVRIHRLGVLALNPRSVDLVRTLVVPELEKWNYVTGKEPRGRDPHR